MLFAVSMALNLIVTAHRAFMASTVKIELIDVQIRHVPETVFVFSMTLTT